MFICGYKQFLKFHYGAGLALGRPHTHVHDHFQDLSLDLLFAIAETGQPHGLQFDTGVIRVHRHQGQGTTTATEVEADVGFTGAVGSMHGTHPSDGIGNVTGTIIPHGHGGVEATAEVEFGAGLIPVHVLLVVGVTEV